MREVADVADDSARALARTAHRGAATLVHERHRSRAKPTWLLIGLLVAVVIILARRRRSAAVSAPQAEDDVEPERPHNSS